MTDNVCPNCGRSLVERTNSKTGQKFWGCSGYPNSCRYSRPLDEDIEEEFNREIRKLIRKDFNIHNFID